MGEVRSAAVASASSSNRRTLIDSDLVRAISSVGRAPPRQGGGHWFEPSIAHSDSTESVRTERRLLGGVRRSGYTLS